VREAIERGEAHLGEVADVHDLFAAAAGLEDWERVRPGRWTRPLAPEIRAVIELERMKGMSYRLAWGVSLAWLPHLTASGTSLHRTAKSARLDVWEFGPRLQYEFAGARIAWVPREIDAVWRRCRPAAEALWAAARTPEGVQAVAERQAAEADLERRSYHPNPYFVAAFTAARLGRAEAAREWFDHVLADFRVQRPERVDEATARERLEQALARVLESNRA
jgi:hypothetical protein